MPVFEEWQPNRSAFKFHARSQRPKETETLISLFLLNRIVNGGKRKSVKVPGAPYLKLDRAKASIFSSELVQRMCL